jgi:cytochrome c oxidase subunit II
MTMKFIQFATVTALMAGAALVPAAISAQTAPHRIEVTARRFSYSPDTITLKKGQPVVLVLKSLDVAHGIKIRELNVLVKVKKDGTNQVEFTPEETGDFVGHCAVFCGRGHGSMKLTVHVVE